MSTVCYCGNTACPVRSMDRDACLDSLRADAFAYAYAFADADANAYAFADANANAEPSPNLKRNGLNVKDGLYLYATPSSDSVAVLRVAWLRRIPGEPDEYEALNSVTPLRGETSTTLDQAQEAPPANWKWTTPLKRPSPLHRSQIRHPVSLDPDGYAKVCPVPKGWEDGVKR